MDQQDNVQVVKQAYEEFKSGNIPAVLARMAENVEWRLPEIEGVPFAGARQGVKSVGQFFTSLGEAQEPLQFEPQEFVAQGDRVVALGQYRWRVKKTGRTFESRFAHVFTLREGRVTGFQEYFDTAKAFEAYR